jgi:hypothetical protein
MMGMSVGHCRSRTTGTLGFFATRRRDGANGFVSCNHVIAASDLGCENDEVLSPGERDGGQRPRDVVGYLDGEFPRLGDDDAKVDCAFARLSGDVQYDASFSAARTSTESHVVPPNTIRVVQKIGRSTGHTYGRVSATDMDSVDIDQIFGTIYLSGQIEIASLDEVPFSRPGDSGALVVGDDCRPFALLCASDICSRLAYANPIDAVLSALRVDYVS